MLTDTNGRPFDRANHPQLAVEDLFSSFVGDVGVKVLSFIETFWKRTRKETIISKPLLDKSFLDNASDSRGKISRFLATKYLYPVTPQPHLFSPALDLSPDIQLQTKVEHRSPVHSSKSGIQPHHSATRLCSSNSDQRPPHLYPAVSPTNEFHPYSISPFILLVHSTHATPLASPSLL